jgi:serine/threonine protein kinase
MQSQAYGSRRGLSQRRSGMVDQGRQTYASLPAGPSRQRQPSAAAPTRFPFTVFGKGRRNTPAPPTGQPGRFASLKGLRGGQKIGHDIMRKYKITSALKKGGMAEAVNIVTERQTGATFVQKSIPLRTRTDYKRARAEINTLLKIDAHGRHSNLNAIIESEINEEGGRCHIILEFCDLGSVEDSIDSFLRRGQYGSESSAWNLLASVANGLSFLHHGIMNGRQVAARWDPICHLDLKPCNIFISSRGGQYGQPRVVLADFGCAITGSDVARQIEDPFMPSCGTPGWYPPEGRNGGHVMVPYYGPKTDIWQLGATLHVYW